ncbi:hypothetical protein WMY93_001759 [Mugilogobius chulae]|uniref:Chromo domain-containing protein n=1 Tax=Mugilogobius chulae TaxID=88201 RepID=A0AAW0PRJ5_9GOBI
MSADSERVEPGESEEEVEDVYEVERIIDMRVEEGEVLYRVRWKNYSSDDDTWEPEAHLEDCREVLLAYKRNIAEAKSKKEAEAKKTVKVLPKKSDLFDADSDSDSDKDRPTDLPLKKKKKKHVEEPPPKEKKKKKKKKERRQDDFRPLPAPETDDEEEAPVTPPPSPPKKRLPDSDEDEEPAPAKKHKKVKEPKAKSKARSRRRRRGRKRKSKSKDKTSAASSSVSSAPSSKPKEERPKEDRLKEERMKEDRAKEDTPAQKDAPGSTNLFEKFLLNCEAKDRAPRRPAAPEKSSSKPVKLIGKIEKIPKPSKESPAQKADPDRTEKTKSEGASKSAQSHGFSLDSDELEGDFSPKSRAAEESRRERPDDGQRTGWDRYSSTARRREGSEPRLFIDDPMENQDLQESSDKTEKSQATLNLGMDLNLDWMTLEDFQKHLNGDDEILSGPPLSPMEIIYLAVKLALTSKEELQPWTKTACWLAAGGQDDILRLLIRKGVRVNGRQKNGTTALMHAAEKNFLTTVAILLEAGAYVNAQTLGGETALMKACKRGNMDVVRLLLEYGADCSIMSKHGKNTAMYFAKLSNNLMVCDLIKDHISMLCSVTEETIRTYFESRLVLLEPIFPLSCHRLCEGPDFYMEFGYKMQPQPEGSGILLFIFHANFQNEITARLCGPCAVHAVVLNDKFQLPIFLDSHFIYSFSPVPGINKLFIRLAESPTAKPDVSAGFFSLRGNLVAGVK